MGAKSLKGIAALRCGSGGKLIPCEISWRPGGRSEMTLQRKNCQWLINERCLALESCESTLDCLLVILAGHSSDFEAKGIFEGNACQLKGEVLA